MGKTMIFDDLKWRGLIENISHEELGEKLNQGGMSFYCGYDPTASSLQIGNLLALLTMKRLQDAGHKPYVLIGGATGMIGDPSGKSDERNLLDSDTLQKNIEGQTKQLQRFLSFEGENGAVIVNNADWTANMSYLDFLRIVGKRFRLSDMLAKDSVKSRLQSEVGISYTEFSYQILQAHDFKVLNEKYSVQLQIGGGDQWGNITAGIDLTRKMNNASVYGLVMPLVTDKEGRKFGKSEGGNTIYLDPSLTSPYKMYQYMLNSDDNNVIQYLKYFSFTDQTAIEALAQTIIEAPHERKAQKALACEVVEMVHGQAGLDAALKATNFFFGAAIEDITDAEVSSIFADVPSISVEFNKLAGLPIVDLLALTPLFKSKGEAKRSLDQKGVYLNNKAIASNDKLLSKDDLASESSLLLRKGKKNYCVVKFKL